MSASGVLRVAAALAVVAACAGSAAWAAWPRIAAVTGLGTANPLGPELTIRLATAETAGGPWTLHPLDSRMKLRLGETGIAFYQAENTSDRAVRGRAGYRVSPAAAARYILPVAGAGAAAQALGPHQALDMPVSVFVDPALAKDPKLAHLKSVTLSLSFEEAKTPERQAALPLPPTLSTEPTRDRHGA
jgi:cytochrome c oxidase assembly protein subunit 11